MLNTSLRRIGEVCAAPSLGIQSVRPAKIFCSSTDIRIRVLSALTILQTIAQGITLMTIYLGNVVLFL